MKMSGQLHAPAFLPRGLRIPSNHLIGGWVGPELVWTLWRRQTSFTTAEILTRIFGRPAHSHYVGRAIPTAALK